MMKHIFEIMSTDDLRQLKDESYSEVVGKGYRSGDSDHESHEILTYWVNMDTGTPSLTRGEGENWYKMESAMTDEVRSIFEKRLIGDEIEKHITPKAETTKKKRI